MRERLFLMLIAVFFAMVSVFHFLRALFGWEAEINGLIIPVWTSWAGFLIGAAFFLGALILLGKSK